MVAAKRSYPHLRSGVAAERSYPTPEVRVVAERSYPTSEVRAVAERSYPMPEVGEEAKRSYPRSKGRRGDLLQGKEQLLRFAGAAVKKYPMSKVREILVRW